MWLFKLRYEEPYFFRWEWKRRRRRSEEPYFLESWEVYSHLPPFLSSSWDESSIYQFNFILSRIFLFQPSHHLLLQPLLLSHLIMHQHISSILNQPSLPSLSTPPSTISHPPTNQKQVKIKMRWWLISPTAAPLRWWMRWKVRMVNFFYYQPPNKWDLSFFMFRFSYLSF